MKSNVILLPKTVGDKPILPFRDIVLAETGTKGCSVDLSILPYYIEALLQHTAVKIAILDSTPAAAGFERLSDNIRENVELIASEPIAEQTNRVLSAVLDEFRVRILSPGVVATQTPNTRLVDVGLSVGIVWDAICEFICATSLQSQFQVNIPELLEHTRRLIAKAECPESTATLSAIMVLFGKYEQVSVDGLTLEVKNSIAYKGVFDQLKGDCDFLAASREACNLGHPSQVSQSLTKLKSFIRILGERYMKIGLKAVAGIATSLILEQPWSSIVNSTAGQFIDELTRPSTEVFIPPVINLSPVLVSAKDLWVAQAPEPIYPYPELGPRTSS